MPFEIAVLACPRCHQKRIPNNYSCSSYNKANRLVELWVTIKCLTPGCDFVFQYMMLVDRKQTSARAHLPAEYDISDIERLFNKDGIANHLVGLLDSLCYTEFIEWKWYFSSEWFKYIVIMRNAKWANLIYKILDPELIHPTLVKTFIVPNKSLKINMIT